jgi:hypothetical protein
LALKSQPLYTDFTRRDVVKHDSHLQPPNRYDIAPFAALLALYRFLKQIKDQSHVQRKSAHENLLALGVLNREKNVHGQPKSG